MSFRTVCCVTGVGDANDALSEALQLCQQTNSHLSVLVIGVTPQPVTYDYGTMSDSGWAEDFAAGNVEVRQRVKAVEKQLQLADISADVSASYCESIRIDNVVGERAQYTDVTLIGANINREVNFRDKIIYGALFHSAKPLMLCPRSGLRSFDAKKVMIAWDSGLPATRAINHALWQMKTADTVHIVMVDPIASTDAHRGEPGTDLAQYLARHDLNVEIEQLASGGRPVAKVLKQHAIDMNADLIVMGAYGHSRLRQLVFGGTTSALLEDLEIAVLMAH